MTTCWHRDVDGSRTFPPNEEARPRRDGLVELFAAIDTTYFHPHAMDADGADAIAAYAGQDVYAILEEHGRYLAYGMLRGWDEGYAIPYLGIAVRRDAYGKGHGRTMMLLLHDFAAGRGASRIRLRVHPDNAPARRLYESLGYVDLGEERGEQLMELDLSAGVGARHDQRGAARS